MTLLLQLLPYLVNILSGVILGCATYTVNKARQDRIEGVEKEKALSDGVEALLRETIVGNYNKYCDRGYCPIYAKESLKKLYKAYHTLGGNDVATELYHKILKMPEEPEVSYHEENLH